MGRDIPWPGSEQLGTAGDKGEHGRHALAAQYLYESIVSPGAYLVEGYANAMPANFADRLTQAEIGHIIAFLLSTTGDARDP